MEKLEVGLVYNLAGQTTEKVEMGSGSGFGYGDGYGSGDGSGDGLEDE